MPVYRILQSPEGGEGGAAPADAGEVVTISRSELEALRARAETRASLEEREATFARELAAREQKAAEWERACKNALRDRELSTALIGRPLVPGAAAQLIKLWRDDFDVSEDRGELKVSSRDGRPVAQTIAERLASPDYAHFCQPSSRGGTATRGTNPTAPAAPAPKTLGEAIVLRWQETARQTDDTAAPFGLGRRR